MSNDRPPSAVLCPLKLVFMGTPAFAVPSLKALHEAGYHIVAVYTQPPRPAGRGQHDTPSPVHEYALKHNLPVFTPVSLKKKDVQEVFAAHKADAAIVVAYGLLLPKPVLEAYPLGCINVHPSLLPRWRGAAPIQRTIMAGDKETALVIMQMDEGLDTGDILSIERFAIASGTTAGVLHDKFAEMAGPSLLKTLEGLQNKTIRPVKQPAEGVTYANKITKAECLIDWDQPAEVLYQHILGLSPFPGAYFEYNGETIKLFDAKPEPASGKPGTVLDDKLLIACGSGALRLLTLQRPGKKRMTADELLRGFTIPPGSILK